tara:strand:- start:290 stop:535 length:246 start_codon:yes stop_codon:yes gene_type:complete
MPTFTFRNKKTEEVFEKKLKISERESFLSDNPNLEQIHTNINLGDPVRLGVRRTDDGFREVMSKIHENNYKSNLSDMLSRK